MNENKSDSNENAEAGGGENPQEGAELSFKEKVKLFFRKRSKLGEGSNPDEMERTPEEIAKFSLLDKLCLGITYCVLGVCYLAILIQLLHCVPSKISGYLYSSGYLIFVPNPCIIYIALILAPLAWLVHFKIWQKQKVNKLRLEDPSEVRALIVEAETAEPRLAGKDDKPDNSGRKLEKLKKEANRLGKLGDKNWTDYQILPLKVMLVDFLKPDDLKARARSSLEKLREYRESMADQFGADHFKEWSNNIKEACKKIDDIKIDKCNNDKEKLLRCKDDAAEPLRGKLRMLLRHVTDFDKNWAEGTAIINSLMVFVVIALPHLFGLGILPFFYMCPYLLDGNLPILNMAVLGVCGSLAAVLLRFYRMYKSDVILVEIGDTKGRIQLTLAILGTALGLVAGILIYAMVAGKLLDGNLFPNFPPENHFEDVARAIFWGIASGFSFELIFNRMGSISSQES